MFKDDGGRVQSTQRSNYSDRNLKTDGQVNCLPSLTFKKQVNIISDCASETNDCWSFELVARDLIEDLQT